MERRQLVRVTAGRGRRNEINKQPFLRAKRQQPIAGLVRRGDVSFQPLGQQDRNVNVKLLVTLQLAAQRLGMNGRVTSLGEERRSRRNATVSLAHRVVERVAPLGVCVVSGHRADSFKISTFRYFCAVYKVRHMENNNESKPVTRARLFARIEATRLSQPPQQAPDKAPQAEPVEESDVKGEEEK